MARWRGGDWCCLGRHRQQVWVGGSSGIYCVNRTGPADQVRALPALAASSQYGRWFFLNENGYPVRLCAFSRQARLLAALDQTGALQIWDLERQRLQADCQEVKDVRELAFPGDGKVLMGAVPGGICRWDVKDGSRVDCSLNVSLNFGC